MKRTGELTRAAETVGNLKGVLEGNDAFQFWLFQKRWPSIAGKTLAEESFISRGEGTVLFLGVTNSVWLQEILMHRDLLLQKIREDAYGSRFHELRPVMAEKKRETPDPGLPGMPTAFPSETDNFAPLKEKETGWIQEWTRQRVGKAELRPIFAKLMENTLKRRKAELARGWKPCRACGALCPPETALCTACREEEKKKRKRQVVHLLRQRPELLYREAARAVPCTYGEFSEARDVLIHRYKENYYQGYGTEEEIRSLLSLLIHKPFSEITQEEAEKALPALPKKYKKY